MRNKKSKLLLVSWVLGLLYAVYLVVYFGGGITGAGSDGELLGAAIATTIVGPHMASLFFAVRAESELGARILPTQPGVSTWGVRSAA